MSEEKTHTPFTEAVRKVRVGTFYTSGNGQIVFDDHATDVDHLTAAATQATQPLYDCRTYVRDLIPASWIGKHGALYVEQEVLPDGEVVRVSLGFVPLTR